MSAPRIAIASLLAAWLAMPAGLLAQAPFDMSEELDDAVPGPTRDGVPPAERQSLPNPDGRIEPFAPASDAAKPPDRHAASGGRIDRYILSASTLRFEGEMGRRSWGVALTGEQARRAKTLSISYNSSIYVAPETSHLLVTINDRVVLREPVAAHSDGRRVTASLPRSVLKAGTNVVTFDVVQRHRTDCTIESTYELWTDVEGEGTGFTFDADDVAGFSSLDDLAAVGFDSEGVTTLRLVLPGGDRRLADPGVLHLVQAVALRGDFRQPKIEIVDAIDGPPTPGVLHIAVGTARELAVIPDLPEEAGYSPTVALVAAGSGHPTLILSGPDRADVAQAVTYVVDGAPRPDSGLPTTIDTTPWLLPPVQMLTGGRRLSFNELAAQSEEFSGRRYHAEFYVGLPGDFYSDAYGEATILLDAAYTSEVRPGSHIDVYVNGFIAANTPLTSNSGDIFTHLPVKVALTHFRPGINRVVVEANLDTEADQICAPGTAGDPPDRFVIFDTSEFEMPEFGRVGRWPNLAAMVGTGSPYAVGTSPIQVVLGRTDAETFAAAATLISRIAISAGHLLPSEIMRSEAIADRPALLVGALDQFPATILTEMGINPGAANDWKRRPTSVLGDIPIEVDPGSIVPSTFGEAPASEGLYDRWRTEIVNPSGIRGAWQSFETWLERTFELSISSLLPERNAGPFTPPARSTLMLVQAPAESGQNWTLVAAPTAIDLAEGVAEVTRRRYWPAISGRIATFDAATGIAAVPPDSQRFIFDEGVSLQNVRLVAANWLSINIVPYALAVVILCGVLGVCTSALLSRLGRRS